VFPCQQMFIKRRSTTTNLFELTSCVIRGLTKYFQTQVINTDFSKVFDSVSPVFLVRKLDFLGFPADRLR